MGPGEYREMVESVRGKVGIRASNGKVESGQVPKKGRI